jgi:predicted NUDIX family NTP pyrophosphohydrolase
MAEADYLFFGKRKMGRKNEKHSAGILMYRIRNGALELLLAHPAGPFWARKDIGAWSIPKGEFDPDEEELLSAAKREFIEETGNAVDGDFVDLGISRQTGGKIVHAWAVQGDLDPAKVKSNTFSMEWPPRSGRQQTFPEIDRVGWFGVETAKAKINKGQLVFIERLLEDLCF